jgi:hypothetical protein
MLRPTQAIHLSLLLGGPSPVHKRLAKSKKPAALLPARRDQTCQDAMHRRTLQRLVAATYLASDHRRPNHSLRAVFRRRHPSVMQENQPLAAVHGSNSLGARRAKERGPAKNRYHPLARVGLLDVCSTEASKPIFAARYGPTRRSSFRQLVPADSGREPRCGPARRKDAQLCDASWCLWLAFRHAARGKRELAT